MSAHRGAFAQPPRPERPMSPPPSYGVPTQGGELMPWSFVIEQLERARNYWVVTVGAGKRHTPLRCGASSSPTTSSSRRRP